MTAIRVIFDGKSFVPQQPVLLPAQWQGLVLTGETDAAAQAHLDAQIRAYYQQSDDEDDAWGGATAQESHRAWDED